MTSKENLLKIKFASLEDKKIEEFYLRQYKQFLLLHSNTLKINGKKVKKSFKHFMPKKSDSPIYETIEADGLTKHGFEFTEIDFIDNEIDLLEKQTNINSLAIKKAVDEYLKHLKERRKQLNKQKPKKIANNKYSTFESMFNHINKIKNIIEALIDDEKITDNHELNIKSNEVLAITEALVIKGHIKSDITMTQRNKLFASKFGREISDKTARAKSKLHNENLTHYTEIFMKIET